MPRGVQAENVVVVRLEWVGRWGTWVMRALMDFINIITSLPPPPPPYMGGHGREDDDNSYYDCIQQDFGLSGM